MSGDDVTVDQAAQRWAEYVESLIDGTVPTPAPTDGTVHECGRPVEPGCDGCRAAFRDAFGGASS